MSTSKALFFVSLFCGLLLLSSPPLSPPAQASSLPAESGCSAEIVQSFVDDFHRYFDDCDTPPSSDELDLPTCPAIEMAILENECLPSDMTLRHSSGPDNINGVRSSGDHPCRTENGGIPEDGRAHLQFRDDEPLQLACTATARTCRHSDGCTKRGHCTASDGGFRVRSDDDCRTSRVCEEDGACYAVEGTCETPCDKRLDGIDRPLFESYYSGSRRCVPAVGPDESCQELPACEHHGFCTENRGRCIRQTSKDCHRSQACKEEGKCVINNRLGTCEVKLDRHCRDSDLCEEHGKCHFDSGECVDEGQIANRCESPREFIDGDCRYPADFDCAASRACAEDDRCESYPQRHCDSTGTCSEKYTICSFSAEYCRNRDECSEDGVCGTPKLSFHHFNKCGAIYGTSRTLPDELRNDGQSRIVDRPCGTYTLSTCRKNERGCAGSEVCRERGRCSAATQSRFCRPTKVEHCQQSEVCEERGLCGLRPKSTFSICSATEQQHCEESKACQEEGFCHYNGGVCEREEDL